jgi:hypothetical protein
VRDGSRLYSGKRTFHENSDATRCERLLYFLIKTSIKTGHTVARTTGFVSTEQIKQLIVTPYP